MVQWRRIVFWSLRNLQPPKDILSNSGPTGVTIKCFFKFYVEWIYKYIMGLIQKLSMLFSLYGAIFWKVFSIVSQFIWNFLNRVNISKKKKKKIDFKEVFQTPTVNQQYSLWHWTLLDPSVLFLNVLNFFVKFLFKENK